MTALLTDNLPLLAGAPNGIKKLRELILELAVRGKLVPQDPSDEPASELLKRIAEEKARLVAEGKIKKHKPLAESAEGENPFGLPEGWSWTSLNEIAAMRGGSTPSMSKSEFWNGDIPWVSPKDMHDGDITDSELKVTQLALDKTSLELVPIGSILLVGRSGILKRKLPAQITAVPCTINQDLKAISPFQPQPSNYVQLMLRGTERVILKEDVKQGTTVQSLVYDKLFVRPFGLPPLAEQHRIVVKVDELMALCDRLEAQQADAESAHAQLVQALLDSLTQASDATDFADNWQRLAEHFHALFTTEPSIDALKQTLLQLAVMGKLVPQDPTDEPASELMVRLRQERSEWLLSKQDSAPECKTMLRKLSSLSEASPPFPLPDSWQAVHLIDCSRMLVDCHNKTAPYASEGIPIIRTSNIRNREFRFNDLKYVNDETYEYWSRRCPPEPGDIMFTREAPMGEAAIIPDGAKFCLGQRTMLVRPMHGYIDSRYLLITLTEPHLLERASTSAIGSTVKHLRVGDVEQLNIPLPPLAEQHRIVAKVDQLMVLCDQLRTRLTQARQLNEQLASALVEQAVA